MSDREFLWLANVFAIVFVSVLGCVAIFGHTTPPQAGIHAEAIEKRLDELEKQVGRLIDRDLNRTLERSEVK